MTNCQLTRPRVWPPTGEEVPDSPVVATDAAGQRTPPGRHTLKILVAPIIGLIVISNVGDALAPKLVEDNPLLLVAMNARNRNLILVTNQLDALSYYVVASLRLLLSDPLFFLIGYWYGDTALTWMEQRTKTYGTMLRQWEKWFAKAAYPLVFIAPNNVVCLFAGAAGMSVSAFLFLNVTGTFARLYLIRRLGEAFERPDRRGPRLHRPVPSSPAGRVDHVLRGDDGARAPAGHGGHGSARGGHRRGHAGRGARRELGALSTR